MNIPATAPSEAKLRRIQKTSRVLRGIFTFLLVFVVVLTGIVPIAIAIGDSARLDFGSQSVAMRELPLWGRWLAGIMALGMSAVVIKSLYHLRRLMDNYSRREVFTYDSARQIHHFGIMCMVWGVLKPVWNFLPLAMLPGRSYAVHIELDALLIGAVIVVISWLAEMATELREEVDATV